MNLALLAPSWAVWALLGLLTLGALQDAVQLKISNFICLAILVLGVWTAVTVGPQIGLWQNLAVFILCLVIGTWMFGAGKLGGGDVKLFAVTALWFDFGGSLRLLIAVALAGGLLAIFIILLRTIGWSEEMQQRAVILRRKGGIPYGVAIALGAMLTISLMQATRTPDALHNWNGIPRTR